MVIHTVELGTYLEIRNNNGDWMMGFQMKTHSKSLIHTELQALFHGLQLAWEKNIYPLEVETDATQVINSINHAMHLITLLLIIVDDWYLEWPCW